MNWLTNFVRPKLRALVGKDVPDNLWVQCTSCEQMLFHREYETSWRVCHYCNHHMRLPAAQRLDLLLGRDQYALLPITPAEQDPLKFRDLKKYSDRLKEARAQTNSFEAVLVGAGKIGNHPAVVTALDFSFMGGSMGVAVGNGIVDGALAAIERRCAYIVVTSSGGARMQEGILSLMQMARTTVAINQLKEHRLPYIVVLADPTAGGVTASFAMLGDIAVAEPGATICFAGKRVIEQTIRHQLPDGFQTSEYLHAHGMVDMVVPRQDLRDKLETILCLLIAKKIV